MQLSEVVMIGVAIMFAGHLWKDNWMEDHDNYPIHALRQITPEEGDAFRIVGQPWWKKAECDSSITFEAQRVTVARLKNDNRYAVFVTRTGNLIFPGDVTVAAIDPWWKIIHQCAKQELG